MIYGYEWEIKKTQFPTFCRFWQANGICNFCRNCKLIIRKVVVYLSFGELYERIIIQDILHRVL